MKNNNEVYFRYKKEDGTIVYCHVYGEKLWDDGRVDDECVYIDMDDNFIDNLVKALRSMPHYNNQITVSTKSH